MHSSIGARKHLVNGVAMEENTVAVNDQTGRRDANLVAPGKLRARWWDGTSNANHNVCSSSRNTKYLGTFNMMMLVWLLAGAGIVVSFIVYQFFSRQHYRQYKDVLANMCDERARMLQHQFSVSMNHVHALSILVSTFYLGKNSTVLDQEKFAEYTARTSFERPLMTGVAYARRVLHSEREAFEKAQGWSIKTMHPEETSHVGDEYAPTIYCQESIGHIISLDMMSGEEDRGNIIRARASGKGALTSPFRLLKSNHVGVVLTFAVYNKELNSDATDEERIDAAVGYLGGAFDVESLVDNLLVQLAKSEDIIVNIYDVTDISKPLLMYGPDVHSGSGLGLSHLSSLDFGDPYRKHHMQCRLSREIPRPTLALGFASGVLAFVALICAMVYNAHKHVKKVEEDYRKMEELKVQAEAADIAKSQFLATVSHEIRTPMNGVLGMLQMLLDTQLDATQQDFARTAQASGKALITLINEVLDQAKIESGRIELEAVPFSLRDILDDVLSLFSGKTRGKGVELAVYVSERVPSVLIGDPGRIRQIITNLVGNSVKFTEKGHIFVCVHLWEDIESVRMLSSEIILKDAAECHTDSINSSTTLSGSVTANKQSSWDFFKLLAVKERQPPAGGESSEVKVFISVEDTGIGIPSQAQKRIFTPFMQADSSTSRTYGGTGIGLSISRCLVELMKGEMKFVSSENIGSTFTCSLVLRRGDGCVDSHLKEKVLLATRFKGLKALIVDGGFVRTEVTRHHLQKLGLQVLAVSNPELVVELLSNATSTTKVDMVLVDKDAWGPSTGLISPLLLQTVKQINVVPKIILMATSMTSIECEKAKSAGYADTIIMKPLRASMIAACLEEVLGVGSKSEQGKQDPGNLRNLLCGKRILVVDDNRVNRIVAAAALKKYGAHVECADSGKAAISMLQPPHEFDACFMDIQMPEMDGFEATRNIRKMEELANSQNDFVKVWHVPILAMTADVIQATYDECVRCKMDGYVSKPFEEEQLYLAVSRILTMSNK